MLENTKPTATVAVKDIGVARKFYEGTLGLKGVAQPEEEALVFEAGSSKLLVYRSDYAGTNQATAVTWSVGKNVDDVVGKLRERACASSGTTFPAASGRATSTSSGS